MPGVLSGCHYNRSTRSHIIVSEALKRLLWEEFIQWISQENQNLQVTNLDKLLTEACHDLNLPKVQAIMESPEFTHVFELFASFCRKDWGPTFTLWVSYLEMVDLLLTTKRSIHESNLDLSLGCIRRIIPWMFSYGHTNYARCTFTIKLL